MAQLKDLIVNGPSRFIGDVYATTFTGNLAGNANTATSATTAAALTGKTLVTASTVTTSNYPTYVSNHIPTMSFMAYWNGAYSGTSSNLTYCKQGTIIGSSNIGSQSVNYATSSGSCSGNAATATKAGYLDTGTMTLYANGGNEINFGGTNTSSIIYFGYRATGSKPVPTSFVFGGSGTATLTAGGFKKKDSSASYVLTGDGGHAAISSLSVNYATTAGSCSGNAATANNADTLDGYHASSFYQLKSIRSNQNSIYDLRFNYGGYDKGDFNGTYKDEYPTNYGAYLALTYNDKNTGALMFFDAPTSNVLGHIYVRTRGAGDRNTTYSEWGTLAYLTDNVASASKWANARTITLTGSVTGSVSIDGSQNVSLATTTNHTHTFASLTSKPTTISGYGITDAYTKTQTDTKLSGYLSLSGGVMTGTIIVDDYTAFGPTGGNFYLGTPKYPLLLRSSGTTTINGNILIHSGNFNSYCPKLDGTGASGTWRIDISGNASTATNADKLDGYHAQIGHNKPWGTIPVITKGGWMDVGRQFEFHYDNTTGSDYSTMLRCTGNYNNVIDLPSASGTLALTTDNVASASKLQNPRTIWGQSFDGTGNVSGGMGAVSYIEMSYSTPFIDFHYNNSTDDFTSRIIEGLSGQLTVTGKLRVGLDCTTSTDYAFYVNGDGYFVDNVITEGDFSSRGDAIIDGHAKVNSLKASNICIECDNSGNTVGHTSEINNYSRPLYIQYSTSNNCCICYGGGNVGIGITSPTYKLHVSGDARIDGTISCIKLSQTSDIKYKTNIKQIEYEEALKIIENLNPVTWDWNENTIATGSSSGFVAQEAEEFIPNAISRDNENNLSLDYTQLHSYEIKVIQEQQKEIIKLKEKLKILEKLIS